MLFAAGGTPRITAVRTTGRRSTTTSTSCFGTPSTSRCSATWSGVLRASGLLARFTSSIAGRPASSRAAMDRTRFDGVVAYLGGLYGRELSNLQRAAGWKMLQSLPDEAVEKAVET